MAKINLLPWREELRKQQQKDFITGIAAGLLLTLVMVFFVHSHVSSLIEHQNQRNQFLQNEIASLDQKIKEIQDLESKRKRLLAKMDVIQKLQASRPEIVHLFDEIARTVPEGVFLSDIVQNDKGLTVNGIAQSNARVSAYMRRLEASVWIKEPILTVIETKTDTGRRGSKFNLQMKQSSFAPEEALKP